ncbi:MAG: response regulator [Thermaerobacter sp.]|nr:response regulator [Thermaerobacter sp.]
MGYILVVEDEPGVRRLVREVLTLAGYPVQVVAGEAEALERARRERPAAALLDLRLPGMGGEELAARLLEHHPGLPLAMMTGAAEHRLEERLRGAGVRALLRKPFDIDEMVRLVRQLTGEAAVAAEGPGGDYSVTP